MKVGWHAPVTSVAGRSYLRIRAWVPEKFWGSFHSARSLHGGGFDDNVPVVSSLVGGVFVFTGSVVMVLTQYPS